MLGLHVTARFFYAGAEFAEGRCVRAAPVIGYMTGWNKAEAEAYCRRRGWLYTWYDPKLASNARYRADRRAMLAEARADADDPDGRC